MRPFLLIPLALAACAGPSPNQGTWAGDVTPKTAGATCNKSRGVMHISGDHVTFIPNEGTWILSGTAEPSGHVTAERIQLGANKQPFETRFDAQLTPGGVSGTYTTPRCTFGVSLQRT